MKKLILILLVISSLINTASCEFNNIPQEQETKDKLDIQVNNNEISPELRERFFELCCDPSMYQLPYFSENEQPMFSSIKYYTCAIKGSYEENNDYYVLGSDINEVTLKNFGFTYDEIKANDKVFLDAQSICDPSIAELVEYSSKKLDDNTYKVEVKYYNYLEVYGGMFLYKTLEEQKNSKILQYEELELEKYKSYPYKMYKEWGLTPYETVKKIIIDGNAKNMRSPNQQLEIVTYISYDGITPLLFLSHSSK